MEVHVLQNALKLLKTSAQMSLTTHAGMRCMDLVKRSVAQLAQVQLLRKSVVSFVSVTLALLGFAKIFLRTKNAMGLFLPMVCATCNTVQMLQTHVDQSLLLVGFFVHTSVFESSQSYACICNQMFTFLSLLRPKGFEPELVSGPGAKGR